MGTNIDDRLAVHATCISNDFLDRYMAAANGDYIKVYLFMLRHRGEKFSVKDAADALNLTDNDIERAVRYWEKQGVFSGGAGQRVEEEIQTEAEMTASEEALERAAVQNTEAAQKKNAKAAAVPAPGKSSLEQIQDDEEFAGILFVAKHVLPSLPTGQQIDTLAYMYQDLKMNAELIEFLLEYCAGIEKTSSKYLTKVAIDWHENGIHTVKQAQKKIRDFEEKKARGTRQSSKPNRFINFQQNDVDYDRIAQKKVMERIQHGVE